MGEAVRLSHHIGVEGVAGNQVTLPGGIPGDGFLQDRKGRLGSLPGFFGLLFLGDRNGKLQILETGEDLAGRDDRFLVAAGDKAAHKAVGNHQKEPVSRPFEAALPIEVPNPFKDRGSLSLVDMVKYVVPKILHENLLGPDAEDIAVKSF
jgi:hypothetical protein